MFLRMARLQKVYHCKVFHMPFSLSLCPTLYVSVHLSLLNLRCFLQRCIYIIFYDANIFSLSLPKSIYKLFLGTCVWLLWMAYSHNANKLCTKHLLYIWRPRNDVIVLNILDGFHYINSYQIKKQIDDTKVEISGNDFKLLLVWIVKYTWYCEECLQKLFALKES